MRRYTASDCKYAEHVLHLPMTVCPDVTYAPLFINIVTNKLELHTLSDSHVDWQFVLLADYVNCLNSGSVTD